MFFSSELQDEVPSQSQLDLGRRDGGGGMSTQTATAAIITAQRRRRFHNCHDQNKEVEVESGLSGEED